jgi:DNA-binding protein HU-beta
MLQSFFLAIFVVVTVTQAFTPPSITIDVASQQQRGVITPLKIKGAQGLGRGLSSSSTALNAAKKKSSSTAATTRKKSSKKVAKDDKDEDAEVINFKKAEFVSAIASKTGLTKAESENALSSILSIITEELAVGKKRISLPGFGTFKLTYRAARKGRNPKTGEEIDISESYSPSFSASKTFKDLCNPDR